MAKEIVTDTEFLSQPCAEVTAEEAPALEQALIETIEAGEDVACLAANQIGEAKRALVYVDDNEKLHVMFNPKFLRGLGAFKAAEECMSIEGESKVTRYAKATIQFDELKDGQLKRQKREFTGWTAQIIQHAIDHCNSKLV